MSTTTVFEKFVDARWGQVLPGSRNWLIATMGLAGEAGETVDELKKIYRDGKPPSTSRARARSSVPQRQLLYRANLLHEMGDVLHYLTVLAHAHGWTLADIMEANMVKLDARDAAKKAAGEKVIP